MVATPGTQQLAPYAARDELAINVRCVQYCCRCLQEQRQLRQHSNLPALQLSNAL